MPTEFKTLNRSTSKSNPLVTIKYSRLPDNCKKQKEEVSARDVEMYYIELKNITHALYHPNFI